MEDLKSLKDPLQSKNGAIFDVMRFFHGDGPACAFEVGHQKGGNYFCWDCGIYAEHCNDIPYSYHMESKSIEESIDKIMETTTSQEKTTNGLMKLYSNIDKVDLIDELHQRNVTFFQHERKDVLVKKIYRKMYGIQRVPALLVNNDSQFGNIASYETLANKPMHDIAGHWKNLLEELPHHLSKKEKNI